jgi:hypothetical protein
VDLSRTWKKSYEAENIPQIRIEIIHEEYEADYINRFIVTIKNVGRIPVTINHVEIQVRAIPCYLMSTFQIASVHSAEADRFPTFPMEIPARRAVIITLKMDAIADILKHMEAPQVTNSSSTLPTKSALSGSGSHSQAG